MRCELLAASIGRDFKKIEKKSCNIDMAYCNLRYDHYNIGEYDLNYDIIQHQSTAPMNNHNETKLCMCEINTSQCLI